VANLAVASDDGRAFDHHAVLDDRAFADENFFADVGAAFAFIVERGFQIGGDVAFNFLESVPREFAIGKNRGVLGLREVEQVGWLEHGGKLGETGASANFYFLEPGALFRALTGGSLTNVLRLPLAAAGVFSAGTAPP
jgi:hypothetical protein